MIEKIHVGRFLCYGRIKYWSNLVVVEFSKVEFSKVEFSTGRFLCMTE